MGNGLSVTLAPRTMLLYRSIRSTHAYVFINQVVESFIVPLLWSVLLSLLVHISGTHNSNVIMMVAAASASASLPLHVALTTTTPLTGGPARC